LAVSFDLFGVALEEKGVASAKAGLAKMKLSHRPVVETFS
jgi:hypothetical protein